MKFFTVDWTTYKLADTEYENVRVAYQKHINEISDRLPENFLRLWHEICLHDGLIHRFNLDEQARSIELDLVTGEEQTGYFNTVLGYESVDWSSRSMNRLNEVARNEKTELLWDELDIDEEDMLIHRILFWTGDESHTEIEIRFREFTLNQTSRDNRRTG